MIKDVRKEMLTAANTDKEDINKNSLALYNVMQAAPANQSVVSRDSFCGL